MKAPESDDGDLRISTPGWTEADLERRYYRKELHDFLCQDPVMLVIRPKLIGELAESIPTPPMLIDKLSAVKSLVHLLKEAGFEVEAVNNAVDLANIIPTDKNKQALAQAQESLKAHRAAIKERNEAKKFAADLHQSERATKYFFRAPKQDLLRSPITELQQDDGSVTEDPEKIAAGHRQYWGRLFQSISPDLRSTHTATYRPLKLARLLRDTVAKLTPQQQAMLDASIAAHDFYMAIMNSSNDKAPDPDGLPIEYYKLAPDLWARIYEVIHDFQLS
ncbi:pollike protein [Phytophthora cinnamomi]|uniref:pollike protein n=1 Tax=Phytophthora cinnamomi TaxID=4785 RepID=UPI00355A0B6C|nr:pollike protein [Phytophthora cinnamomi]